MALFKSSKNNPPAEPTPPPAEGQPVRKDRPTPTRREAEAARMARLNPQLDRKTAKQMSRQAAAVQRNRQLTAVENLPERQLIRDVIDSRLNVGEIALPLLLLFVVLSFVPQLSGYAWVLIYLMWAFIFLLVGDSALMWIKFKKLARQRLSGRSLRGLLFYGWNRQMSFRRWRQPPPRVKRGDAI